MSRNSMLIPPPLSIRQDLLGALVHKLLEIVRASRHWGEMETRTYPLLRPFVFARTYEYDNYPCCFMIRLAR
jgi:hypothetical protein